MRILGATQYRQLGRLRTNVGAYAIETRCRLLYDMREIIEDCSSCTSRDVACAVDGFAMCNAGRVMSHMSAVRCTQCCKALLSTKSFPRTGAPKKL
jgi:hypothetical protein